MRTIHKFRISEHTFKLDLPQGAKVLSAQLQNLSTCIWVELNTENPTEQRSFKVYATGSYMPFPHNETYICTWQNHSLVWHLYEVNPSN